MFKAITAVTMMALGPGPIAPMDSNGYIEVPVTVELIQDYERPLPPCYPRCGSGAYDAPYQVGPSHRYAAPPPPPPLPRYGRSYGQDYGYTPQYEPGTPKYTDRYRY